MNQTKTPSGTIDCSPSWSAVLPVYMAVLANPTASENARRGAMEELERMAKLADAYVVEHKAKD